MVPSTGALHLDVEAISGICGSISIACWVVVFSPQILENFRRSSADGLSLQFIIVWLAGDVFNILGAVLQGVLPTMVILAVYYTIADIVLLLQCFYYRGFTWKDEVVPPPPKPRTRQHQPNERTSLLNTELHHERRDSWSNLSPAVPNQHAPQANPPPKPTSLQTFLWNTVAVLMVCAAGVLGWFLSRHYYSDDENDNKDGGNGQDGEEGELTFNLWGQIFGWLCAVLYLGSRLPQLLLNYRRKSTEGVSMLFFLFACLGNLTYVLSIFAYDPHCRHGHGYEACIDQRGYARYMAVNASWLAGSLGTLLLDMGVFVQFFIYRDLDDEYDEEEDDEEYEYNNDDDVAHEVDAGNGRANGQNGRRNGGRENYDQRPLLARGDSSFG